MNDPKQLHEQHRPKTNRPAANDATNDAAERQHNNSDSDVEESLEGEGSPGLTITGGGGHA
jgi:hypothetical protein